MLKFKDLPKEEKPRERLILYGKENLSNEELLMIILKNGTNKYSVKELAFQILSKCGDIRNLKNLTLNKLTKIEGIGQVKAIELLAIVELAKRIYTPINETDIINCTTPTMIIHYFNSLFQDKYQEEFYVIYLDNKKKYLEKKRLFIGSINTSIAHPREIFKNAYLLSASFIICIHNHPSGDPTPSKEDIQITKNLYQLGTIHAIYLIDHIIIGKNNYYSFYEDQQILNNN
ncbi:MAG: DNA repair protein RadC [Erysipelotrichaceae bacterium]|nr:DNA repair protein RadC [Erysipelotrichaceae bacterium]